MDGLCVEADGPPLDCAGLDVHRNALLDLGQILMALCVFASFIRFVRVCVTST